MLYQIVYNLVDQKSRQSIRPLWGGGEEMKSQLGLALLAGVSLTAVGTAYAQAPATDAAAPAPQAVNEVVVTGSRVIKNGNNSPTPVTVISPDLMLKVQPTTVIDAVNLMPALQGSQSLSSNPGGGQRNGAAAYINLRDMGDLRTLVLMDGHRVVPTINQNQGNVDSWVIPQLLIKRVDVVTGGVSAVYGSDAISGVVNFVTDNNFNGIRLQGSGGVSTYGDDVQRDFGGAFGHSFAGGRGHFEISYENRNDPGILDQRDRPWFAQSLGGAGAGTVQSPYYNVTNTRISNTAFGGLITSGPLSGLKFSQNGILTPFVHGASTGTSNVESGGDGAWYATASIKSSMDLNQVFSRIDYDLEDNVHSYLQVAGTWNHTSNSFRSPLESVTLGYNNPFVQAVPQLAAQAALTPNSTFGFSKLYEIPGTADQWTNTYMFHGGLNGDVNNYHWDFEFGQSQSQIKAQNEVNVDQGRFLAAANAVRDPATGKTVCNAALTNPTYASCIPLNMFGPTSEDPAALNYVLAQTWNKNTTTLSEVSGSVTGAPVRTWAGPVNMALSGEWRQMEWSVASNAGPNDPIDCGGIQFGCTGSGINQTPRWLQNTQPALPKVSQTVNEVAYEVELPLVADVRFVKSLQLNGAARYTDYSTSGSVTTWKVGGVWKVDDDLTLRSTVSRDIRAPNLFELYAPTTIAPTTLNDTFTQTGGRLPVATVSNSSLTPERANSITAGFVWIPHFVPGFSFSVDAFHIKVDNAIAQLSGNSSSILQLCNSTLGANPVCPLTIVRPFPYTNTTSANFPTILYQKWLNIASFETYGADFEGNYATRVLNRPFTLRALVSYQPHLIFNQGPAGIIDLGNSATGVNLYPASAAVKWTVIGEYDITDKWSVVLLERGRSALRAIAVNEGQPQKVFSGGAYDPATAYTNLTVTYRFMHPPGAGRTELYLSVQNLFNAQPNVRYAGANTSPGVGLSGFFPPNGDDIVGRYFTLGFRTNF
jgi:outer membrane receptor protein involved in Fe transport